MALPEEILKILPKVKGLTQNSKEVEEGYLFFAVRGSNFDGHDFVGEAFERGAIAAVVEEYPPGAEGELIRVEDTRKALAESAHIFFKEPSKKLKVVGVTGTNGKTTTTYVLERILREAGLKAGLVGTVQYRLGEKVLGEGRTTPEPVTWHGTLRSMLDMGASHVVAEVSSHALDQYRVWGTEFEAVIFTNLTQDHLDYHGDMESYFLSKRRLFTDYDYDFAVVNSDDPCGRRLLEELGRRAIGYGREGDLRIIGFETDFEGSKLTVEFLSQVFEFRSNLIGDFQAYNLSAALTYALKVGIDPEVIQRALESVYVPGRFEVYRSPKGFLVIVDYAHTPDAIDNVLRTVRRLAKGRVITVFGAGGNRDRGKRPLMGKAAERWSDLLVVTSDNPRFEDPKGIIEDILEGIRQRDRAVVIEDRREAISESVNMAREGDIVAILGKGHEEYQEIGGVKYPFSDAEVVKEMIQGGTDVL